MLLLLRVFLGFLSRNWLLPPLNACHAGAAPQLSLALCFVVSYFCSQTVSQEGQDSLVHLRVPHSVVPRAEQGSVDRCVRE